MGGGINTDTDVQHKDKLAVTDTKLQLMTEEDGNEVA